jgi:DNA-binding CsgD family transcriptional regulator
MALSRRTLVGLISAGVVAGSALPLVGGVELATAQQPTATATATAQKKEDKRDRDGKQSILANVAAQLGVSEQRLREAFVKAHQEHREARLERLSELLAPTLGLTAAQIEAQLNQGRTIAQIASQQGKSRESVRSALLAKLDERLKGAVAKGRLTSQESSERRQKLEARLGELLDKDFTKQPKHGRP